MCERLLGKGRPNAHWSRAPRIAGQTPSSDRCPAGNTARPVGRGTRRYLLPRARRICGAEGRSARLPVAWRPESPRGGDRPRSRACVDRVRGLAPFAFACLASPSSSAAPKPPEYPRRRQGQSPGDRARSGMHGRRIRAPPDGASRELRDGLGGGSPMSTRAHPLPHRFHWPHRWVVWLLVGLVGLVAAAGIVVGIDRAFFSGRGAVFVAAGAVRGAGDRRPLRHLRRSGEPREAERAHDRAPRGRPACVSKPARKTRSRTSQAAGGAATEAADRARAGFERAEPVSRHAARRPARHRGLEPTAAT